MIKDSLEKLRDSMIAHNGECILCISTTANVNNPPLLVGSSRLTEGVLAGNLIVRDPALLPNVITIFDKIITKYFIDCEIKIDVDLKFELKTLIPIDSCHFFKPNDFTVEAADEWIAQRINDLYGIRVAIIGAGNIGSKLALLLAERGGNVRLFARREKLTKKVAQGLCAILRGSGTITAVSSIALACKNADIIIGSTPGIPVIDKAAILSSNATLLLDIGNGCFAFDAISASANLGLAIEVLSPLAGWEGFLRRYATTQQLQKGLGRRQLDNGCWIVSRGIMGMSGDVIVDEILTPNRTIGVCNGMGDLLYNKEANQQLKLVRGYLGIV